MKAMNWATYLKESERTMVDTGLLDNLVHGAIGIATEIGELKEAFTEVNRNEEIGDIFWYIAIFYRELNLPQREITHTSFGDYETRILHLYKRSIELLDQCKKIKFYKKEVDVALLMPVIVDISSVLEGVIFKSGYSKSEIWRNNINKLRVRFPDKFNSDKALNRDLESELRELEK